MPPTPALTVVDSEKDFGPGAEGKAAFLLAEVEAAEKDKRVKRWRDRGNRVVLRYRDERDGDDAIIAPHQRKYNILWSNVQTLIPALFGRMPQPVVERRYSDPDPVARVASLILERVLSYQMQTQGTFKDTIRYALQDRLLPGMGCVWVRYQQDGMNPAGDVSQNVITPKPRPCEAFKTLVDFVYWRDLGYTPSRTWEEVPRVWRTVYMTRDALIKRFGAEIGKAVPLNYVPSHHKDGGGNNPWNSGSPTDEPKAELIKQAVVYELWEKSEKKVYWLNPDTTKPLDVRDDPYGFADFFPCPKPMFATNTTGNLCPVPDYCEYQDQAQELDVVVQRLAMLTQACKVIGVYDAEQLALQRMLTEGIENQMIPVDTWAAFAEKGGIKGVVDWLPLDKVIEVITQLTQIKAAMIQDIYQITGISDIIRGASSPNATATEQRIKAQYASIRLDDMKMQVAQFITDTMRLMAHLAIKFFPPEILIAQSTIMQSVDGMKMLADAQKAMAPPAPPPQPMAPPAAPPGAPAPPPGAPAMPGPPAGGLPPMPPPNGQPGVPPPVMGGPPPPPAMPMPPVAPPPDMIVMQAVQLLKSDEIGYRVDVEASSLIEPDEIDEREARGTFMTAVTQFLQQAVPAVQSSPESAPMFKALLLWSVRGFRVGRDIEGMIDAGLEAMANPAPKPPPPDPARDLIMAKLEATKQQMQNDAQEAAAKQQRDAMAAQAETAEKLRQMQEKHAADMQAFQEKTAAEVKAILIKAGVQAEVTQQQAEAKAEAMATTTAAKIATNEAEDLAGVTRDENQHLQNLQHAEDDHQQGLSHTEEKEVQGIVSAEDKHQEGMRQGAEQHEQGLTQAEEAAKAALKNKAKKD